MTAKPRPVILIVEDIDDVRDLLTLWLGQEGYKVVAVDDGCRVSAILESGAHIDVIVTDYSMPEMDGAELVAWLRASPFAALPVLLFTADSVGDIAGVQKILKGGDPQILLDAIAAVLRSVTSTGGAPAS